jgi:hypothetical protein
MVLFEDGQSRMRVEGLPVEVGLDISVNEIWTEDGVVVVVVAVVGFAGFAVSLFKDEVCGCVADAALGRRERPPPRPPPRAAAIITTMAIATNAQNALLLSLPTRRFGVSCNFGGSHRSDPEPE